MNPNKGKPRVSFFLSRLCLHFFFVTLSVSEETAYFFFLFIGEEAINTQNSDRIMRNKLKNKTNSGEIVDKYLLSGISST